jgi:hypothetical protein
MEIARAHGAEVSRVNVSGSHAAVVHLAAIGRRQVNMAIRIRECNELLDDLGSHFVATLANSGTDGYEQVVRPAGESRLHVLDSPSGNPLRGPTPAGVDGSYSAMARIDDENRDAVGGLNGDEPSWGVLDEGIAVAERTRPAAGFDHNVRMDLMECGQVSTTAETVRPAGTKTMHQPIEGFQRLDAIDVLRIFVEHYTGF